MRDVYMKSFSCNPRSLEAGLKGRKVGPTLLQERVKGTGPIVSAGSGGPGEVSSGPALPGQVSRGVSKLAEEPDVKSKLSGSEGGAVNASVRQGVFQ
jgi:hypothetical protein